MSRIWVPLALIALWWPSRISGPLDGVPLDTPSEAIILGLILPLLCWLERSFLADRRARGIVLTLLLWKAATTATLVQDGWCVTMLPSRPYVVDGVGPPHGWDVRADWRRGEPSCTAIMTRAYRGIEEFPVWFFNLSAHESGWPGPEEVPPGATTLMKIRGTLTTPEAGVFKLVVTPDISATIRADGQVVANPLEGVPLSHGSHAIEIDARLTGEQWRFEPLWNDGDVWKQVVATVTAPSAPDLFLRPWARWAVAVLASTFLAVWAIAAVTRLATVWVFAWVVAASSLLALCATQLSERYWHYAVAALALGCLLPLQRHVTNPRGALLLVGVPWLVLVVTANVSWVGRMTFYTPGDDWWQFQGFAYRIYHQGYWLEGGEPTFWFQPFYRWIAGALHLVFGDSSVGEDWWDGAALTVMVMFGFAVVRAFAGFRWGILAAVVALATYMAGPGLIFVGRGLSEISSAGLIYLAALLTAYSRGRHWRWALAAGICATLGAWTRLNNLPMAVGVLAFALPLTLPVKTLRQARVCFQQASRPTIAVIAATLVVGFTLFALRTWHYTGLFSVIAGTQFDVTRGVHGKIVNLRVWKPGQSFTDGAVAAFDSLLMVLTSSDPPHFHSGALPLIAGTGIAAAAVLGLGAGPLGKLPLPPVLFCLSSIVGAFVARGHAYPGRFSIHVIGAASAVLVCAISLVQPLIARYGLPRSTARPAATIEGRARENRAPDKAIPARTTDSRA